jgi:nitroreductase
MKNRSYRRFNSSVKIQSAQIEKWIELARFSPSARNLQPLKFAYCTDEETNKLIFPHLGWAGYLKDWAGPAEGEQPMAYIAVLKDKSLADNVHCDDGIAIQSILLGAVEDSFGGCIIGTVNKSKVTKILKLPDNLEVLWMIALGKPAEKVELETATGNEIKYWRDKNEVHHVPKRPLDELIIKR